MSDDLSKQLEENPFSFKKFVKISRCSIASEDVCGIVGHDLTLDRIDTEHTAIKKSDENPFSFKKFVQSCDGRTEQIIYLGCDELANELPDFVKDNGVAEHELPDIQTFPPTVESCVSSFELDSIYSKSHSSVCDLDKICSTSDAFHEIDKFYQGSLINNNDALRDDSECEPHQETAGLQHLCFNAGGDRGSCPLYFISDSGLETHVSKINSTSTIDFEDSSSAIKDERTFLLMQQLQEENRILRQQLLTARAASCRESARVKQLLKDIENAHKYEVDETAALEMMIQQVEGNLQATLQRAVNAEDLITKLKEEIKALKNSTTSLVAENEMLKSKSDSPLKEKSTFAAQQISAAADNAEQLLKQLLSGVDNLKIVASVLSSMDQVTDIPVDDLTD